MSKSNIFPSPSYGDKAANLRQLEQSLQNIENYTREVSHKVDRLTQKMDGIEQVIQSLKGGMSAFTKSLAELLQPFYNWMTDKVEGNDGLKEA